MDAIYQTKVARTCDAAHKLRERSLHVVFLHAQSARVVVARPHGDNSELRPSSLLNIHESVNDFMNDSVSAKGENGVVARCGGCHVDGIFGRGRADYLETARRRRVAFEEVLGEAGTFLAGPAVSCRVCDDECLAKRGVGHGRAFLRNRFISSYGHSTRKACPKANSRV